MISNTVVVYEKDHAVREAVRKALEPDAYVVLFASDPKNLLTLIGEYSPWLLVLAEDAIELNAVHPLREKIPDANIAIIALTGWYQGMHPTPFGADMALTKPFNPQELKLLFVRRLRAFWIAAHPNRDLWTVDEQITSSTTVVVYDEPATEQTISRILATEGHFIQEARSVEQLLSFSKMLHPWLIVLAEAVLSPDERQAIDQLFAQGTKVIFLDAHPEEPGGGMRAFPRDSPITLNKPFNPMELVQVARRLRIWWEDSQQVGPPGGLQDM